MVFSRSRRCSASVMRVTHSWRQFSEPSSWPAAVISFASSGKASTPAPFRNHVVFTPNSSRMSSTRYAPQRSPYRRSVMSAISVRNVEPFGKSSRNEACADPGLPSSSVGQVSRTIVGITAIRASSGQATLRRGSRMCISLLFLFVVRGRQAARAPAIVPQQDALLGRYADPDLLLAHQVRGRMRAGAHEIVTHSHQTVEVIAEERRDAQRALELVGRADRTLSDLDVLRSEDE